MAEEVQELGELETVAEEIEQQSADKKDDASGADDSLPAEYKGKSVKEIVQLAESRKALIGRQANEVGEIRKLADELIKSQLHQKPKEQETQPEVDFFENPQEAIRRAVESNPKVQAAEQYAAQVQREMALQKIAQKHPDFQSIAQSDDFLKWVGGSSIRLQLFNQANAYDFASANELFSTFKELKAAKQAQVSEIDTASRKKAIASAAVDTGGSGVSTKKVYRRADVMKIMMDPVKYRKYADEIELAYSEGRVR